MEKVCKGRIGNTVKCKAGARAQPKSTSRLMEKSLIIANNVRKFYVGISRRNCRRIYGGGVRAKLRGEMRGDKKPRCTLVQLAFASSVSSKISPTLVRPNAAILIRI